MVKNKGKGLALIFGIIFIIVALIVVVSISSKQQSLSFLSGLTFDAIDYGSLTPETKGLLNSLALVDCEKAYINLNANNRNAYLCQCEPRGTGDSKRCEYRLQEIKDSKDELAGYWLQQVYDKQISLSLEHDYCPPNTGSFVNKYNVGACIETTTITQVETVEVCPLDNRNYLETLWDAIFNKK